MKALTIHQPWASLIAWKVKRYETRNWGCNYRGAIAVHASKHKLTLDLFEDAHVELFDEISLLNLDYSEMDSLRGAIIAIANLKQIHRMTDEFIQQQTETERLCGDWKPGRYAWEFENVQPIQPIFIRGQQGLWNSPESLIRSINVQT